LLQRGYRVGLVKPTAWPPYGFKEVLGELCGVFAGGGGEEEEEKNTVIEDTVVVRTEVQCPHDKETEKKTSGSSAEIKTSATSLKDYKEALKKRSRMKRAAAAKKAKLVSGKKK
jgi:hypothetical protein